MRWRSGLICLTTLALCMFSAAQLAEIDAHADARRRLAELGDRADRRAERVRREAADLVAQWPDNRQCEQKALRGLLGLTSYVRNIGKIQGSRVYCDAIDGASANIELGAPDVVRADGVRLWLASPAFWAAKGTNAIQISSQHLVDTLLPPGVSVAVLEAESGRLAGASDAFPKTASAAAWRAKQGTITSHGYRMVVVPSRDGRTLIVAAQALETIEAEAVGSFPYFLPFGAVAGIALGLTVVLALNRRGALRSELRRALKKNQLEIVLQPIMHLGEGDPAVAGFECLARWSTLGGEVISPAVFVPLAEQENLTGKLACCVVKRLVQDFGTTLRARPDLYVSINLSAHDIADGLLLSEIDGLIEHAGLSRHQLVVELTETVFDVEGLDAGLARLRAAGHRLSIDDFGTGASNASRLAFFHPEIVKIDRAFVLFSDQGGPAASLLPQLISMALSCGAKVVVEGVETEQQARRLARFEQVSGQGYFWHPPLTVDRAKALVARKS